ncbi:MAG: hypothetical protein GOP50_10725 [Candidatus Heimdallarchaeota archaeon]|nr:hypothetical protein [Candidatus Heimdallarchaeota archaeon]
MAIIWGDTEETQNAAKRSFEDSVEQILKEKGVINLNDLMKLISHDNNLLTDFQRILKGIDTLIEECKVIIDQEKNIRMTTLSVLGTDGLDELPIWDIIHKEKDIEIKKEIIRRYNAINPLL